MENHAAFDVQWEIVEPTRIGCIKPFAGLVKPDDITVVTDPISRVGWHPEYVSVSGNRARCLIVKAKSRLDSTSDSALTTH